MNISKLIGKYIAFAAMLACILCITLCACSESEETLPDGSYEAILTAEGGSGRATIDSPVSVEAKDGQLTARLIWSSTHFDYMIVDGEKYLNESEPGERSSFTIPVAALDEPITVIGDTTAMSKPHEIEYTLTFHIEQKNQDTKAQAAGDTEPQGKTAEISVSNHTTDISRNLKYTGTDSLHYAKLFSIDRYEDGYALITIDNDSQILVVPEGKSAPDDIDASIIVAKKPIDKIYLAASSAMDMFVAADSIECIKYTSVKAEDWYIDEAKKALEDGSISYAGKYSSPDYEQLVSEGCRLAIENTMIFHDPQAREMLESLGIPVIVEYSSYESEPMGRCEWIKLYGCLTGREEEAAAAYDEQEKYYTEFGSGENDKAEDGKAGSSAGTVAFFYITTDGQASVRTSTDYIPAMIRKAGGEYIFSDLMTDDGSVRSTKTMTMEEFYAAAKDADYIIYNSSIDGEIHGISDLTDKSELLAGFKAVKNGNVYCTSRDMYQSSMEMGSITRDIHCMLTGDTDGMEYIFQVK